MNASAYSADDATFLRWMVGDVTITRVFDVGEVPIEPEVLFPDTTRADVQKHAWLAPDFADPDGRIVLSFHAFVIASGSRRIIVDTCVGNDKPRAGSLFENLQTRFLEDLAAAGYPPESIDTVVCTHLHADHVGWNTRLVHGRWVPTFPNARYVFVQDEWANTRGTVDAHFGDVMGDSVQPIVDAGMADLVAADFVLADGIRLIPTPGHTAGHVSIEIESGGARALITGDAIHHPIQCARPDLITHFCELQDQTVKTRRALLERLADSPVLVLGTHFGGPTSGWIRSDGDAFVFETRSPQTPTSR